MTELQPIKAEKRYDHFISLGHFCSVASELERLGLRSNSYPFDWVISDFTGVMTAIEEHFSDYMTFDLLAQHRDELSVYTNTKYQIRFVHDFDKYHSLKSQLPKVTRKYNRRIERFYRDMTEPTLFVRYISDIRQTENGKNRELEWIEDNLDRIGGCLRSYNPENDILFVANNGVESDMIPIVHVEKDEGDTVARRFVEKSEELNDLFTGFYYPKRDANRLFYVEKLQRRSKDPSTYQEVGELLQKVNGMLMKEYIHTKQL